MCFGGGGSDKSSREMIALQKQEAAAARQKEADRQARINAGLGRIKGLFEGTPVMKNVAGKFNWGGSFKPPTAASTGVNQGYLNSILSSDPATWTGDTANTYKNLLQVAGLPAGYTYTRVADPAWKGPATTTVGGASINPVAVASGAAKGQPGTFYYGGQSGHGGGYAIQPASTVSYGGQSGHPGAATAAPATPTAPSVWAIRGPDGKLYYQGQDINTVVSQDTGKTTGGFGSDFYNKFKQGMLDYYLPQVATKYGEAKDETAYRLARAGLLKSGAATKEVGKLAAQNTQRVGEVKSKADTATGQLKTRVAQEKQNAVNQLYSTENPDVATNTALASVRNITADKPDLSPLGDIFDIATIGAAGALQGYNRQKYLNQIPGYNAKGATKVVSA